MATDLDERIANAEMHANIFFDRFEKCDEKDPNFGQLLLAVTAAKSSLAELQKEKNSLQQRGIVVLKCNLGVKLDLRLFCSSAQFSVAACCISCQSAAHHMLKPSVNSGCFSDDVESASAVR